MQQIEFKNETLERAVNMAKENGLQVFTFEKSHGRIEQIFVTDGINIGTISAEWSGIKFSTIHKPSRENGTGFGLTDYNDCIYDFDINDIKGTFIKYPSWAKNKDKVVKYKNVEEYFQKQTILKYYYL